MYWPTFLKRLQELTGVKFHPRLDEINQSGKLSNLLDTSLDDTDITEISPRSVLCVRLLMSP
jgi:hypothetical protein